MDTQYTRRAALSGGGTVYSVSDAGDILSQMAENGDSSLSVASSSSTNVRFSRPLRTYGRARKLDDRPNTESTSPGLDSAVTSPPMKRKRDSLVNVIGNVVVLRDRVSMRDHLQRLLCLLTWSDRHGGRWMGIRQFIDCYFSLMFQPYLGDTFKLNIIHVANKRKICALFSAGTKGSYTILVMLNYPLWDRILRVSVALPNRYFRRSVRSRMNDDANVSAASISTVRCDDRFGVSSAVVGNFCRNVTNVDESKSVANAKNDYDIVNLVDDDGQTKTSKNTIGGDTVVWYRDGVPNPVIEQYTSTPLFKLSLAALCLVDRLEYSMQIDRESVTFSHVMTLARFFSNSQEAKRLFRTNVTFQ